MIAALRAEEEKNNPEQKDEDEIDPDEFHYDAPDKMDLEKEPLRMKGKETLELKLATHAEKIDDIFVNL